MDLSEKKLKIIVAYALNTLSSCMLRVITIFRIPCHLLSLLCVELQESISAITK